MSDTDFSGLSRPFRPRPRFVLEALEEEGLMAAYQARAPYQRNDDLGRISRPSRPETEEMRPRRMLDELARADVSMKRRYALGGRPRKQEEAAP